MEFCGVSSRVTYDDEREQFFVGAVLFHVAVQVLDYLLLQERQLLTAFF